MLDYKIHTFLTVCSCMNFTKAAQLLNMTQPGVSQHIHKLEEEYEAVLFTYQEKKLFLTDAGEKLLLAARTMEHDITRLKAKMNPVQNQIHRLSFGATLTIGEFVMPSVLSSFLKAHPDTHIKMTINNTAYLLHALKEGLIDFALIEGYFEKSNYDYTILDHVSFLPVASPDFIEKNLQYNSSIKKTPLNVSDLFSHRLFVREDGSGTKEILSRYLQEHNFSMQDFSSVTEINSMHAIKEMVCHGNGMTFLYRPVVEKELKSGVLTIIPLKNWNLSHEFTMIRLKGSIFPSEYSIFYETMIAALNIQNSFAK